MGGTIIHTQVQFSDRRPLKDMQNILDWYDGGEEKKGRKGTLILLKKLILAF